MKQAVNATQLRRNVYRILDQVLETGKPCELIRQGRRLQIVSLDPPRRKLDALPQRKILNGSFDELVEVSWADAWDEAQ